MVTAWPEEEEQQGEKKARYPFNIFSLSNFLPLTGKI
jgi:hypothetical protein